MATLEQRVTALETELTNMKAKLRAVLTDILNDRKQARTEETRIETDNLKANQQIGRRMKGR